MINIISSPAAYHSGHDANWFVADSTDASASNYKYVCEIYVSGERVYAGKAVPSLSGGYGVFNVSPIIRNFYGDYFEPSGTLHVASNDKFKVDYQIRMGEDNDGTIDLNMASAEFSAYNYYAAQIYDPLGDGLFGAVGIEANNSIEQYGDSWLTDRNFQIITSEIDDIFYLTYFRKTAGDHTLHVKSYNEAGSLTDYASGEVFLTGEFNLFNLSADHINSWAGSAVVDSSTHLYHVYLTRGAYESPHAIITHECQPKHHQKNLHFLNRLGGWDSMRFSMINKRTSDFTRSAYKRSEYQLNGTAVTNYDSFGKYNAGTINYAISHRDKYKLVSNWVEEIDINWLAQLVSSPSVYIEINGIYYPVSILTASHEYKTREADKLFNFEIEVEIGKQTYSQFR